MLEHREAALLSKRLVTLRRDVPITLDLEALRYPGMDRTRAHALFTELEFAALAKEYAPEPTATRTAVEIVDTEDALRAFVDEARQAGQVSLSLLRSAPAPMRARLVGIGLCATEGRALYVPLEHPPLEMRPVLPLGTVMDALRPLLADPAVRKLSARGKLRPHPVRPLRRAHGGPRVRRAAGRVPAEPGAPQRRGRGPGAGAPAGAPAADRARCSRAAPPRPPWTPPRRRARRRRTWCCAWRRRCGRAWRRRASRPRTSRSSCRWSKCWPTWSARGSR